MWKLCPHPRVPCLFIHFTYFYQNDVSEDRLVCVHFIPDSQFPQAPGSTQRCMRWVLLAPYWMKARLPVWSPLTPSSSTSLSGTAAGSPLEDLSKFLLLRHRPEQWWVPPWVPRWTQTCFWPPVPRVWPCLPPGLQCVQAAAAGDSRLPRPPPLRVWNKECLPSVVLVWRQNNVLHKQ